MNINKAIEILRDLIIKPVTSPPLGRVEAIKLGIEALKREQEQRIDQKPTQIWLLPGETL